MFLTSVFQNTPKTSSGKILCNPSPCLLLVPFLFTVCPENAKNPFSSNSGMLVGHQTRACGRASKTSFAYLQGGVGKACINTLGCSYFLIIYENVKKDVTTPFCWGENYELVLCSNNMLLRISLRYFLGKDILDVQVKILIVSSLTVEGLCF